MSRVVKLIAVREFREPDYWLNKEGGETISHAEVDIEVDGEPATLLCRPYQMPVEVNGLRLYVELTRDWANSGDLVRHRLGFDYDARLTAVAADESWGPTEFRFPIINYRWRSSSYNNTWSSLVPYNVLYYHRGEDIGAVPDKLDVVAPLGGRIVASPLPTGGGSNAISIRTDDGATVRLAHCNLETVVPSRTTGGEVQAGDKLARTGETYQGRKQQYYDPHLHTNLSVQGETVSTYPYFTEAYLRDYSDDALAVAGGYCFTVPGREVELDATRSVAREGEEIAAYEWRLHDGRVTSEPRLALSYAQPGLYSEELRIRTTSGYETRDFAQVRVYDPGRRAGDEIIAGWVYYTPVRGVKPGDPVTIWPRLFRKTSPIVSINYGDGQTDSGIPQQVTHTYDKPGVYTVTISTTQPGGGPVTSQTSVVVEY